MTLEALEDRRMLAVFTVDTAQDVVDPVDGRTSLREAILAASAQAGADQIVFDFGHTRPATLLLEQGELQLADVLTIRGPGSARLTSDAQQRSRIFSITAASGDFAIEGLAIVNGRSFGKGGGLRSNSTGDNRVDGGIVVVSRTGLFADGLQFTRQGERSRLCAVSQGFSCHWRQVSVTKPFTSCAHRVLTEDPSRA